MNKRFRKVDEHSCSKASKVVRYTDSLLMLVIGALMMSESVASEVANQSFMFLESVNRGFKFVVGLIAIVLATTLMDIKVNEDSFRHSEVLVDEAPSEGPLDLFSVDRHDLLLREWKTRDLRSIQKIILEEEKLELSLNETLARVLSFSGRFVPFGITI